MRCEFAILLQASLACVVLFQVWDRDELDFSVRTAYAVSFLEILSQQRLVDPRSAVRAAYLKTCR